MDRPYGFFRNNKGTKKGTGQNKNAVSIENTAFLYGGEAGI